MNSAEIQELCRLGQDQLMGMEYLLAEKTLALAEGGAWGSGDFDALSRLYMPLQEARRQRRQRCGEGIIRLDILARDADDEIDGDAMIEKYPHGQLLIGGWGSIQPAIEARRRQAEAGVYVDVLLGAVYPAGTGRVVVIVPSADVMLPMAEPMGVDKLIRRLPAHSIVMSEAEAPKAGTYSTVMDIWERLHAPFVAAAEGTGELARKIEAYRKAIGVDYACELAHQGISDAARQLSAMRMS
jgi:hypothetical protein